MAKRPHGVLRKLRKVRKIKYDAIRKEIIAEQKKGERIEKGFEKLEMRAEKVVREKMEKEKKNAIIKKEKKEKRENQSNRIGAKFETKLQEVFDISKELGICYISKMPISVSIIRKGAKIVSAVPNKKSDWLDFLGIFPNGKVIMIEAKTYNAYNPQTGSIKPFPLANIQNYQLELIHQFNHYGVTSFFLIQARLTPDNQSTFLVHSSKIIEFKIKNQRKSIPYDELTEMGIRVREDYKDIVKILQKEMLKYDK